MFYFPYTTFRLAFPVPPTPPPRGNAKLYRTSRQLQESDPQKGGTESPISRALESSLKYCCLSSGLALSLYEFCGSLHLLFAFADRQLAGSVQVDYIQLNV